MDHEEEPPLHAATIFASAAWGWKFRQAQRAAEAADKAPKLDGEQLDLLDGER